MKNLKSIFLKTECSQALCKQTKSVSPGQLSPLAHDSATCGWDEGVSLWAPLPCPPVLPQAAAEAAPDLPETQPCRPPPQVPGGRPRADRPLSHLPGSLGSARGDPSSRPAPRLPNSDPAAGLLPWQVQNLGPWTEPRPQTRRQSSVEAALIYGREEANCVTKVSSHVIGQRGDTFFSKRRKIYRSEEKPKHKRRLLRELLRARACLPGNKGRPAVPTSRG